MDFQDTINIKCKEIHAGNKAKGFWEADTANIPQLLMLTVSELSEALEADRKDAMDDHLPGRRGVEVELADAVIRIMDMCGGLNLDLGGAIEDKLKYNAERPFKHGKKY